MAESLISVFLEPAKGKLSSLISDEFQLLWGVEEDLEKLSSLLSTIRCVLQDAEERQVHSNQNQVRDWLRKLKDAAYDADDVLDEFATEALRSKVEGEIQTTIFSCFPSFTYWTVRNFCISCFRSNPVLFRHEIAHKIKEINERFDQIVRQRNDLHLREGDGFRPLEIRSRLDAVSLIDESGVFGRENDKEKLINLLMSDGSAAKELTVIPIVGMGGLGKTTITQLVYNDDRVEKHFDVKGWVCVSEDFDLKRITKAVIESISKERFNCEELEPLVKQIQEIVTGKKFLLVLDDVWKEDSSDWWEYLSAPLRYGAKGSKVIVTTRSEIVSSIMGTIPSYLLGILSNADCWSLLRRRAFPNGSWDGYPHLVTIGQEIAKKCKGLPLAAKTLGGLLLLSKREERKWKDILTSEMWELPQRGKDGILGSLRLSYHHLPSHLKQCFMYCAIFPKDHEFDKDKLVKLWMAEGFIMSEGAQREMEDVGSEYFDELLWRSFFQYYEKRLDGRLIYKMHDLIHDLAQSVSEGDCFRMEGDKIFHTFEKTRHLSCFTGAENDSTIFETFLECKRLHTLLVFLKSPWITVPDNLFPQIKFLRVLDFSGAHVRELPDSIGNLKHLRYLDLSFTDIKRVPESTCNLCNLQTLDVSDCWSLVEFPKDIRKLINLRHLTFSPFHLMSLRIGGLTCLQTLSEFVVGKESGHEIGQLMSLINLRGKLWISKLQNVRSVKRDSTVTVLKNKQYIEELNLEWDDDNDTISSVEEEKERILEILEPHPNNLRKLKITGYNGVRFSSWIGHPSFSKLVEIQLFNCRSCETLPTLGQLLSLETLYIREMDKVRYMGPEFCGVDDGAMINSSSSSRRPVAFPSLKHLNMGSIPNLVEWGGIEEGDFPLLEILEIWRCESLTSLPKGFKNLISLEKLLISESERLATLPEEGLPTSLQSLYIIGCPLLVQRCQEECGEDWPKISHIPELDFE